MNNPFKKMFAKTYPIFCKCPNCNYGCQIKIPQGISVAQFVKGGKVQCDKCAVVFFPDEYTTEFFEEEKIRNENKDKIVIPNKDLKLKKLSDYKKEGENIKWM